MGDVERQWMRSDDGPLRHAGESAITAGPVCVTLGESRM